MSLTDEETQLIIADFTLLTKNGLTKKAACNTISDKYGRGYWAILNILRNSVMPNSNHKIVPLFN
jgi:hypothetical protein